MYRISTKTVAGGDWLTLGEASRLLGVDPDTLRRWADNGKIDVFTTPGGHRRFLRASIDAMLPRPRQARRQSLTALGEAPDRVASEFRRRVRTDLASQDWYSRFDEDSLRWFRERGMRMSELLLGHLDTTRRAGRDQLIEQASLLGREYGVEAKRRGLSLGEATQAFLFFRARFMAEIAQVARRRALASEQASLLFEEADRALDRVILALIQGHQA
ncbi:MAG: helix-turn-helix domain-containing protein [Chloroflexi bacterium]|nr:MAG: helix-turn-helix domain-containing protein [Chloroflexota bacterium]TMG32980.1 MAG: helix-turn-helix domain-containing protein [Chloroflexota bacterium]